MEKRAESVLWAAREEEEDKEEKSEKQTRACQWINPIYMKFEINCKIKNILEIMCF